jgi:hypothetical protein
MIARLRKKNIKVSHIFNIASQGRVGATNLAILSAVEKLDPEISTEIVQAVWKK